MSATRRSSGAHPLVEFDPYRILLISAIGLVVTGTIAYHLLEDWSVTDSLYFSVIAVTTVGFGDLATSTDASKLFTVLSVLWGIAIVTTFLQQRLKPQGRSIADRRSDNET